MNDFYQGVAQKNNNIALVGQGPTADDMPDAGRKKRKEKPLPAF
jgi:hypothetical protein